jgi:hypothetical protein
MNEIFAIIKRFWIFYLPAWVFFPALVLLFRGFNASTEDWSGALLVFSLIAGIAPWVPWFRRQVSCWANVVPAILVPLATLLFSIAVMPPGFAA